MEAAKALYDKRLAALLKNGDANNTLFEIESIYDYSPEADLPKIKAHVMLINNVEDFADPPTLGTIERAFKKDRARHLRADPVWQEHARTFHPLLRVGLEAVSGEIHGRSAAGAMTAAWRRFSPRRVPEELTYDDRFAASNGVG